MWTLFICERHSICVPVAHFWLWRRAGRNAIRQALSELMICPMLHLPDVSKAADALLIFINGGPGMGMNAINRHP